MAAGRSSTAPVRVAGADKRVWVKGDGVGEKVRVFVGTEPKTEIARKVLECGIRRRASCEVTFVPMIGPEWEYDRTGLSVGTGFSLRRWMIPAYCGWQGRAVYLDADQVVYGDVWELWSWPDRDPAPGRAAWMTWQPSKFSAEPHPNSSVMVIDCAAARAQPFFHIDRLLAHLREDPGRRRYVSVMYPDWMTPPPGRLPVEWNHLNVYEEGRTKLLHYTREPDQPWYRPDHPLAYRWMLEFQAALTLGCLTADEVREAVARYGRPDADDWRPTAGLHPRYLDFLPKAARRAAG